MNVIFLLHLTKLKLLYSPIVLFVNENTDICVQYMDTYKHHQVD